MIILFLLPRPLKRDEALANRKFIVWNIGQGQFTTLVENKKCYHFDVGGEFFQKEVLNECRSKENTIFLSHWDWDHIGLTEKLTHQVSHSCLAATPRGSDPVSKRKLKILSHISRCDVGIDPRFQELYPKAQTPPEKNSNAYSHVWEIENRILVPGDSQNKEENLWAHLASRRIEVLILGHHGSKTSTSETLLKHLPHLKMAVASARWIRYHHPNSIIVDRLKKYRIPLIKTEDWGNIIFEM